MYPILSLHQSIILFVKPTFLFLPGGIPHATERAHMDKTQSAYMPFNFNIHDSSMLTHRRRHKGAHWLAYDSYEAMEMKSIVVLALHRVVDVALHYHVCRSFSVLSFSI